MRRCRSHLLLTALMLLCTLSISVTSVSVAAKTSIHFSRSVTNIPNAPSGLTLAKRANKDDNGDDSGFDDLELPGLDEYLPSIDGLEDNDKQKMWDKLLPNGIAIKAWLDKYVDAEQSRLEDLPAGETKKDLKEIFKTMYTDDVEDDDANYTPFASIDESFRMSGTTVQYRSLFKTHTIFSGSSFSYVLEVGVDADQKTLVTLVMNAKNDNNPAATKLRSSELHWQAWRQEVEGQASSIGRPTALADMKYWMQRGIVNIETNTIMELAHRKFPGNVDNLQHYSGYTGSRPAGHGLWKPPRNEQDEAGKVWTRLIATANLKVVVHMLADHADVLDNKYPIEIHTFPVEKNIVVVLGEKPIEIAAIIGTIDTEP